MEGSDEEITSKIEKTLSRNQTQGCRSAGPYVGTFAITFLCNGITHRPTFFDMSGMRSCLENMESCSCNLYETFPLGGQSHPTVVNCFLSQCWGHCGGWKNPWPRSQNKWILVSALLTSHMSFNKWLPLSPTDLEVWRILPTISVAMIF